MSDAIPNNLETMANRPLALVTGANGGMGKEICKSLLEAGFDLLACCRPGTQGDLFVQQLASAFPDAMVREIPLELANYEGVLRTANMLVDEGRPLDVLINNAGMLGWKPETAPSPAPEQAQDFPYEKHYVVNCLSPIVFTWSLKPLLRRGSRVVNVVSCTIRVGKVPNSFPYPPIQFNRFSRYSDSKYCLFLFTLQLAFLWKNEGITVNAADPGIVNTPIITMHNWVDPLCNVFFRPFITQPAKGASTAVFLALDPSMNEVTGGYYYKKKARKLPKRIYAVPSCHLLWRLFVQILSYGNK